MTAPKAPWNRQPNPDPLWAGDEPDEGTIAIGRDGKTRVWIGSAWVAVGPGTDRPRLRLIAEAVLFYAVVLFLGAGLLWLLFTWRKP